MIGWAVHTNKLKGKFEADPWWHWGERGAEAMVAWDRDVAPLLGNMPPDAELHLHSHEAMLQVVFVGWTVNNRRSAAFRSLTYSGFNGPWRILTPGFESAGLAWYLR